MDKFSELLNSSNKILITAHMDADADSLSSTLLLNKTIRLNYPDKDTLVSLEELKDELTFIDDFSEARSDELQHAVKAFEPDLLILLDANNLRRASREPETVRNLMNQMGTKFVIIDHHEPLDKDEADVYINSFSPAIAQDIYEICFDHLKLKKPEGYANLVMLGIYADTGGFIYENPQFEKTFKIVIQLVKDGANIENIANELSRYSQDAMEVLGELIKNLKHVDDCTYTYVSDEFTSAWLINKRPPEAIAQGFDILMHSFLRNIDGRPWGFAVYPDVGAKTNTYKVSFRAVSGTKDVAKIAQSLKGGGHKEAAGARIEVGSVSEALDIVKQAILRY